MNYIKFRSEYSKYNNSIVPDIRSKLFDRTVEEKQRIKIGPAQIRRIAAVTICFVIVLSAVLVEFYSSHSHGFINNTGALSQNGGFNQGGESEDTETDPLKKYKPREGATKEEAEQTTLTTDKTSYCFNEKVKFTIKSLYENDSLSYGYDEDFYVQYFDSAKGEWDKCPKTGYCLYIAGLSKWKITHSFKISDRIDNVADKYRLVSKVTVNKFDVNITSNEFTIDWNNENSASSLVAPSLG